MESDMEQMEWQLVPKHPTEAMSYAGLGVAVCGTARVYKAMLDAAPEPPHLSMTEEDAAGFQNWKGMDGACAFHLIERHANGWGDTARMMEAWLAANVAPSNAMHPAKNG
jgi:hypothetical protein